MDTLPAAILTKICGHLVIEDVPNFRLVNRACSQAGIKDLFGTVTVYMACPSYIHLMRIASHHGLAKAVHSMVYKSHMVPTEFKLPEVWVEEASKFFPGSLPTAHPGWVQAYRKYLHMEAFQTWVIFNNSDFWIIHDGMAVLKGLKKITVDGRGYSGGYAPFDETLSEIGHHLKPDGVRHVNTVLCTAFATKIPLQKLRVDGVDWQFFMQHTPGLKLMLDVCKNLTSIHLHLFQGDKLEERHAEHGRPECYTHLRKSGAIRKCFAAMPELQTLKLTFDGAVGKDWHHPVRLRDIIGDGFVWPKLQKLQLNRFTTDQARLLNVMELHKSTLKCLRLEHVTLKHEGSWLHVLTEIRDTLQLTSARITGWLLTGHDVSDGKEEEAWDLRGWFGTEVDEYLVDGGVCPLLR